ncbi:MAG: hypothetical protein R2715_09540 [Ilumatobacteraceae bacterium]
MSSSNPSSGSDPQVGDVLTLVKGFVRQETLGPLKGAGRWIAFGAAGSIMFGLGVFFSVLGILRLFQTETAGTFGGNMSILPYVFALLFCLIVMALAVSRIKKTTLQKESRR